MDDEKNFESIGHAITHLQRATKKEIRDERKMGRDAAHAERDAKKNNLTKEIRDDERVEKDIYHFLYHTIRSMNYLIEIEKKDHLVELKINIKNKYSSMIEKEVKFLINELRSIGSLDSELL